MPYKVPFDIIGDVHGCFEELYSLLLQLGYNIKKVDRYEAAHPQERKLVFVGDLVDRGPNTPEVLRMVMDMVATNTALCVAGNHDDKLRRKLQGRHVQITNGLAESLEQLQQESLAFQQAVLNFLEELPSHYVLDQGRLAVAHAGLKEEYIGKDSSRVRAFCLYGQTTGELDDYGLPVRHAWAQDYQGDTLIVYGHTPVSELQWVNNTINIDTGCVFGGQLTALRYPERVLVSVPAAKAYYQTSKAPH